MLETHLQTRLINRTTRNLSLTEAGTRYLEGCRGLLEELDHLESTLAHTEREPSGTLRVVASGALSLLSLTPLLNGFSRLYPKIRIRLTVEEGHVDLVEDGYDVGIVTAFMVMGNDLVERPIGTNALVPCASPAYLAEHGEPRTPEQLAQHAFVGLPPDQRSPTWNFTCASGPAGQVTLKPSYTVNSALMVRLAALAGMGIAILPSQLVADDLASGALKRIIPDYTVDDPEVKVSIVYPRRQYLPTRIRAFIDYALEHFASGKSTAPVPQPEPAEPLVADLQEVPGV